MRTLKETLDAIMTIDPPANAIECQGIWWRWADLAAVKDQFEAVLAEAGLGGGIRVGTMLRNEPACVAVLASVMAGGRCLVTLNPALPDEKLAADIRNLRLPVVAGMARDWARPALRQAAEAAGVLGILLPDHRDGRVTLVPGLERLRATDLSTAPGIAMEMLTSGTTGTPKRIPLKAALFEKMLYDAALYERGRQEDDTPRLRSGISFVMVPFAHIGGVWGVMNTLVSGRQTFLLERFAVAPFVDGLRRHRPRVVSTPPAVLRMVLDAGADRADLACLKVWRTSTAPLDPDLADRFLETYGIPVLQVYGATEFAGGVAGWTLADFHHFGAAKRGSVGRLNPGIQGRILDPDSREPLPAGREGVLSLCAGHLGNGRDWLDTTDRAVLDEDGFLFIRGRYDNAIIRGGFKVMPDDVVKALEQHPAILEAAVGGISDPRLGEVPVAAYIVKAGHAAPEPEALKEFLRDRLSPYQIPVALRAVQELPRTASMKVSVLAIREMFATQQGTGS